MIEEVQDQERNAAPTRAKLVFLGNDDIAPAEVVLSDGALDVGRSEECGLTLNVACISRRHALIEPSPSGWVLRDLGSTNGSRVNQQRVTEAALASGDLVAFANIEFRFVGNIDEDDSGGAATQLLFDDEGERLPAVYERRRRWEALLLGQTNSVYTIRDAIGGDATAIWIDEAVSQPASRVEELQAQQARSLGARRASSEGAPWIVASANSGELTPAGASRLARRLRQACGGACQIAVALHAEELTDELAARLASAELSIAIRDFEGGDARAVGDKPISWVFASPAASRSTLDEGQRGAMLRRQIAHWTEAGVYTVFTAESGTQYSTGELQSFSHYLGASLTSTPSELACVQAES